MNYPIPSFRAILATCACTALVVTAQSQVLVWDGDTDGVWSDGTNWGGTAPVNGDDLEFGTSTFTNQPSNNDIANLEFGTLTFGGSTDVTLSGNALTTGGSITVASDPASPTIYTINSDLSLSANTNVISRADSTIVLNGVISGPNRLIVGDGASPSAVGSTIVELNGDNTFDTGFTASSGTTVFGSDTAVGAATNEINFRANQGDTKLALGDGVNIANAMVIRSNSNNKTLTMTSAATSAEFSGDIEILQVDNSNSEVIIADGQTLTLSGVISGANAGFRYTADGASTIVVSGDNTNTGQSRLQSGVVRAENNNAFGTGDILHTVTATLEVGDGVTLANALSTGNPGTTDGKIIRLQDGATSGGFSGDITIDGTNGGITLDAANGGTFTVSGDIGVDDAADGNNVLAKTGAGTVVLSGNNTYEDGTEFSDGILQAGSANALGTGDLTFTGGTLQHSVANAVDYSSRIKNSTDLIKIDTNGQNVTWASVVDNTNTGGLFKDGLGTLTLSAANTYTGPSDGSDGIINGTVRLENDNALSADFNIGVFGFNSLSNRTMALEIGDGVNVSTDVVMRNNSGDGSSGINKVLRVAAGETAELSGNVNIIETSDGVAQIEVGSGGELTISGNVSSNASSNQTFTKTGDGTLILSGTDVGGTAVESILLGDNSVDAGTLLLNGDMDNNTDLTYGGFTVASGAAVGGDGIWGGDLTLEAGAQLVFDVANTLDVLGAVSLDNTFGVDDLVGLDGGAIDWSLIADNTYSIIGSTLSDFSNIENFGSANAFVDGGSGKSIYFENGSLDLVVVPEPATYALIGGLLAFAGILVRRRGR